MGRMNMKKELDEGNQEAPTQTPQVPSAVPCYADSFYPGDELFYNGPLPIDGKVVVVKWEPSKWIKEGCIGDYRFRPGLIPVYSEKFPKTKFWWVSKFQVSEA